MKFPVLKKIISNLSAGQELVIKEGLTEALLILEYFNSNQEPILIIKNNLYNAQRLMANLGAFLEKDALYLFPADESLRINAVASSPELLLERLRTLAALDDGKKKIIITHAVGLTRFLPAINHFKKHLLTINKKCQLSRDQLVELLKESGYYRISKIEAPLQYATRGDILDIYSVGHEHPFRIEFAFDQIESIRFFDANSQKTFGEVSEIHLLPATDILLTKEMIATSSEKLFNAYQDCHHLLTKENQENLMGIITDTIAELQSVEYNTSFYQYYQLLYSNPATLLDYFCGKVFFSNPQAAIDSLKVYIEEAFEYQQEMFYQGKALINLQLHKPLEQINLSKAIRIVSESTNQETIKSNSISRFASLNLTTANIIRSYLSKSAVIIALSSKAQREMVEDFLSSNNLPINHNREIGKVCIFDLDLAEGVELNDEKVIILSKQELFNVEISFNYFQRFSKVTTLNDYNELSVGDYVVHDFFGIGRFVNIETTTVDGITRDYLKIAYAGTDMLFVPVESFAMIKKFISREGIQPKLNRLSGEEWKKTKARIKNRINELADKLIQLYNVRTEKNGFAYPIDDALQQDFEARFPYKMTAGQETSLREIKEDMERPYPMDRLLCGDVGFGKTEVAFRIAFKAMSAGKQVLFLCPTTVLARQHYLLAKERFAGYFDAIELLSRFVSQRDIARIQQDIKENKTKLLIATHKALSDDLSYYDLGLIIVDEEQRFGVAHKEKIKMLKQSVDVLSLTATPIPRTLQFSLIGIRGLSQIETPPEHRLPVQTYVLEKSDFLVKEVISRELSRHGQVFYLYNNIARLSDVAFRLQKVLPQARIACVHGQMLKEKIEKVMEDFYLGKIDILISTTIIESGLDIPNANTIIIENSDHFGLSQLYQIRGRVGRSDRLSYCYLLYNPKKELSELALKRLQAIKEFTELGSGYKIALRDLTIRGAGDLLGPEQSGFIDTVGIDLYLRLLKEAIAERRGEAIEIPRSNLNLAVNAYVPSEYAGSLTNKFDIYKRIMAAKDIDELATCDEEIKDLHGKKQQQPFKALLNKRKVELLAETEKVVSIKDNKNQLEIILSPEFSTLPDIGESLFEKVSRHFPSAILSYRRKNIYAIFDKVVINWLEDAINFLLYIRNLK